MAGILLIDVRHFNLVAGSAKTNLRPRVNMNSIIFRYLSRGGRHEDDRSGGPSSEAGRCVCSALVLMGPTRAQSTAGATIGPAPLYQSGVITSLYMQFSPVTGASTCQDAQLLFAPHIP